MAKQSRPARPRRTPRQWAIWQAKRLVKLYILYMVLLSACQRWLIFPRHFTHPEPNAGENVPGLERIWLDTTAGRVEAWFLPAWGVSKDKPGPAVIVGHGNAELIDEWPDAMIAYRGMGVSVLLPEYRGYGRSAGSPSEKAIVEDFVRFYDILAARPEVDPKRIFFHGRSVGGGAVCGLSRQRKPAALILQSPFISITEMSKRYLVPSFFITDPFDNLSAVRQLDCPIIIFHGRHDTTIPFVHGQTLAKAAKHAKLVAYDCDHNDCPPDWPEFMIEIRHFLVDSGIMVAPATQPADGAAH